VVDFGVTLAGLLGPPLARHSLPDLWRHEKRFSVSSREYRISVSHESVDVSDLRWSTNFRSLCRYRTRFPNETAEVRARPTASPTGTEINSGRPRGKQLDLFALLSAMTQS
jgi:hypothetical protein